MIHKPLRGYVFREGLFFTAYGPLFTVSAEAASANSWMIILGTNHGGTKSRIKNYKNVVLDVQYYYPHEIKALKAGGKKIYSYMSIGSLETYRPYYKRFKKYALGRYANWGDERWIDVSKKPWQDFIVNELVASVLRKGADGLWLDNTDVYYHYHRESIYKGLLSIITRIYKKGIPIYINGGDEFVTRLINSGKARMIKGVFQEEVVSSIISYNGNRFGVQNKSARGYYEAYLRRAKRAGLNACVLEYTKSASLKKAIIAFCNKNKYGYYISSDVHLR